MCGNPNTRLLARLIIDFLLLLGVYCVALVVLPQQLVTVHRGFHCSDASLRYPYRQPWLTKVHLTMAVVALPAAFILVVELLRAAFVPSSAELKQRFVFVGARIPSFVSECYKIIGVYLFGLGLALLVIRVTKFSTGRLRPYFFDVCQPSWGEAESKESCELLSPRNASRYIDDYSCTEFAASLELLALVRHSFPSGFVATTSYAMCFLVFYAQARLFAPWLRVLRSTLQLACGAVAMLVCLERISTYQNHLSDVAAGLALGVLLASFMAVFVVHLFRQVRVKRRQWPRNEQIYGYAGYYNRATYGY
ncbi:putative phosphatidate phosphatase [Drosophila novamexicana]|uniref:putative phosphatidate phosphatase n=1 Tax=Drosophila novamexicana TaxID=47314 RepID=UPI0011E5BC65|nr:putative phosphatidate phosphatase [Drosophila novamexicana]